MNSKPKLFLLDAYALIFRAYYAFIKRPMMNSKGLNTSAIYGFISTLLDVLKREKPEYLAVAFDPPSPTFRHAVYKEYKANRQATPEEIIRSVPYIKSILKALRIQVLEVSGFEADDVIGTLAKKAEQEGWTTYMMTPDKDYTQLVSDNIFIYKPSKSGGEAEVLGVQEVNEMFGIEDPLQVIDILALWGDSTDNIPGVPGIGQKTSKDLIAKYKSIDNLISKSNELKDKLKENITSHQAQIQLSKKLAKIITDIPIELELDSLKTKSWNEAELKDIFQELEFKTLYSRALELNSKKPQQGNLFEKVTEAEQSKPIYASNSVLTVEHKYHLISSLSQLQDLIGILAKKDAFCFDTETTGLDVRSDDMIGIAIAFKSEEAYYIKLPEDDREISEMLEALKPVFGNPSIKKIGQNIKFDLQILRKHHIAVEGELFDTMIAHYLIQPELRHNMDYLAEIYLDYQTIKIEDLIGKKGKDQKNLQEIDIMRIKEYACEDADITWQLYQIFFAKLREMNLIRLAENVEMPLIRVLADMEDAGFTICAESLNKYSEVLRNDISTTEKEIHHMAGQEFNISSPKQLGEILFEKLRISDNVRKTKTNQYSTSEEVLNKLIDKHPIVNKILEYRAQLKLLNTYVDALPVLIDKRSKKIHTSFDQAWVATGRLSSRNPNLQNIPIKDQRGREIRKAFIPSDQHVLLSADYSQIELRLMAHLSNDDSMIEAFIRNEDIHTATASKIFKVESDEVTREMRNKAKIANFGIIYGISSFGLAQRLDISRKEASELIDGYFTTYSKVKEYMNKCIVFAKENGFVETIMGRRRYLKDINSANGIIRGIAERNAINAPLQGSAADIIKYAMVNIYNRIIGKLKSKMILQVHDELIFDVYKPELEEMTALVKQEMEHVMELKVPLLVEIGVGSNWLEAH